MEKLDKHWIFHGQVTQNCELFEKTPNTLGLKNMAGVFILVGVGIAGGVGLIIIEVIYKKHQVKKQKRLDIARHAADKWRGNMYHVRLPTMIRQYAWTRILLKPYLMSATNSLKNA